MSRTVTRALDAAPIAFFSFVAVLMLTSVAVWRGLVPNDTLSLWAGAIIAGDGLQPIGRIVAAYPTIPFVATAALEYLTPAGTPAPALLAAVLMGLLAGWWFIAFRGAALTLRTSLIATALITFHPAMLRAAMGGPGEVLVAIFLFLLGVGLFDLRERGAAPEVMLVGVSLLVLAFSHPMGAAIACAAVPFLVFAVRPTLVANSALNVVLVLVFPAAFSVAAFTYVSWVFPGSGWSFYSAPSSSLSAWAASVSSMFGGSLTGVMTLDTALAFAAAFALSAPLAISAAWRIRRRQPLLAPLAVLAASTIVAAAISVATGLFGDPAAVAVAAPVLCAVVIIRIPSARANPRLMAALLALGWIGGALALIIVEPRVVSQLVMPDIHAAREQRDSLALGRITEGRKGVLVDTDNAPEVVIGRADARGLLSPAGDAFTFAVLLARVDTPYVAVPNPQSTTGAQDRLNRSFPQLYRNGAPGYRQIYSNDTWRLYEREPAREAQSEARHAGK